MVTATSLEVDGEFDAIAAKLKAAKVRAKRACFIKLDLCDDDFQRFKPRSMPKI